MRPKSRAIIEACYPHLDEIAKPGTTIRLLPDGSERMETKWQCRDCGDWYVEEKERKPGEIRFTLI